MITKRRTLAFIFLFFILGLLLHIPVHASAQENRILVQFRSNDTQLSPDTSKKFSLTKKRDLVNHISVFVAHSPDDIKTIIDNVRNNLNVLSVEKDELVSAAAVSPTTPNDPSYTAQWYLPKIQADYAWSLSKATEVKIGVCDSGFAVNHPDLQGVFLTALAKNTVDDSADITPSASHGTWISGIIAASTNNAQGVAGTGWGAKIIPVKITNRSDTYAYVSDAIECISYAADNGAKVINLSYGMAGFNAINQAASYALSKGAITVISAGNEHTNPGYTDYPNFLVVSSTDINDNLSSFSNYGTNIDISAPGSDIFTTDVNGGYEYVDGTSFSAAVISGVLGLVSAYRPAESPQQLIQHLYDGALDLGATGKDVYYGVGRVNAYQTLDKPPSVPTYLAPQSGTIITSFTPTFSWRASVPTPDHYELLIATVNDFAPSHIVVNVSNIPGTNTAYKLSSALSPNTVYYWVLRAVNQYGQASPWTPTYILSAAPAAPLLNTPFTWQTIPGAASYTIWISNDWTFGCFIRICLRQPLVSLAATIPTTSYIPSGQFPSGITVYWKVRATSAIGNSAWSNVSSYKTPTVITPTSTPLPTATPTPTIRPTPPCTRICIN
jgi:hypothetical protein